MCLNVKRRGVDIQWGKYPSWRPQQPDHAQSRRQDGNGISGVTRMYMQECPNKRRLCVGALSQCQVIEWCHTPEFCPRLMGGGFIQDHALPSLFEIHPDVDATASAAVAFTQRSAAHGVHVFTHGDGHNNALAAVLRHAPVNCPHLTFTVFYIMVHDRLAMACSVLNGATQCLVH